MDTIPIISSRGSSRSASTYFQYVHGNFDERLIETLQHDAYLKGRQDGFKDMEIELIKRGKALFQLAIDKACKITESLLLHANDKQINIVAFYLKVENWDNIHFLIIVGLDDFIGDNIDSLYRKAMELESEFNDDTFHWSYNITYYSESLNKEKILTDGFDYIYEHTPQPRKAQ